MCLSLQEIASFQDLSSFEVSTLTLVPSINPHCCLTDSHDKLAKIQETIATKKLHFIPFPPLYQILAPSG